MRSECESRGLGTGEKNVPRTRMLESRRYVAQTFLSAGSGDFPVARPSPTSNHTAAAEPRHRWVDLGLIRYPFSLGFSTVPRADAASMWNDQQSAGTRVAEPYRQGEHRHQEP